MPSNASGQMPSMFVPDSGGVLVPGAVYKPCPVAWLRPPLWLVRDLRLTEPQRASFCQRDRASDAFQRGGEKGEEDLLARGKERPVIVISSGPELSNRGVKEILVAPLYSFHEERHKEQWETAVRSGTALDAFYVPECRVGGVHMHEGYISFRGIHGVHRDFLKDGLRLPVHLDVVALKALLNRYRRYLTPQIPTNQQARA
ncbi:MAG: hypothetical protein ACYC5O_18750 [Anaerolineae bacterium]